MTDIVPQGRYRSAATSGSTVISAGITPRDEAGELLATSHVGAGGLTVHEASELAALTAQRAVAACRAEIGAQAQLTGAQTLTVYIRSAEGFIEHTRVADGASKALQDLLPGPSPARTAVGVASLPGGAPLELQLTCAWKSV